jgi:hypothetical protein
MFSFGKMKEIAQKAKEKAMQAAEQAKKAAEEHNAKQKAKQANGEGAGGTNVGKAAAVGLVAGALLSGPLLAVAAATGAAYATAKKENQSPAAPDGATGSQASAGTGGLAAMFAGMQTSPKIPDGDLPSNAHDVLDPWEINGNPPTTLIRGEIGKYADTSISVLQEDESIRDVFGRSSRLKRIKHMRGTSDCYRRGHGDWQGISSRDNWKAYWKHHHDGNIRDWEALGPERMARQGIGRCQAWTKIKGSDNFRQCDRDAVLGAHVRIEDKPGNPLTHIGSDGASTTTWIMPCCSRHNSEKRMGLINGTGQQRGHVMAVGSPNSHPMHVLNICVPVIGCDCFEYEVADRTESQADSNWDDSVYESHAESHY